RELHPHRLRRGEPRRLRQRGRRLLGRDHRRRGRGDGRPAARAAVQDCAGARAVPRRARVAAAGPARQGVMETPRMKTLVTGLHTAMRTGDAARRMPRALLGALAAAALLALPQVVTNPSHLNLLVLILMAAQLGVAWNILGGYAGQVSLGHVAFF